MVELDDQDFADLVALQYLPTGHQNLVRLAIGREIFLVWREMRVEKRVSGQKEVAPFAVEHGGIVLVRHPGSADRLVMDQPGVRGGERDAHPLDSPPGRKPRGG